MLTFQDVDLLYNLVNNKSTTNGSNGVWAMVSMAIVAVFGNGDYTFDDYCHQC